MEFSGEQLKKDLQDILQKQPRMVDLMIVNQRFYKKDFKNLMKEIKLKRIKYSSAKTVEKNIFIDDIYKLVSPDKLEKDELLIYARAMDDKRQLCLSTFSFGSDGFIDDTSNYPRRLFYSELFKNDPDFLAGLSEVTQTRIKESFKSIK